MSESFDVDRWQKVWLDLDDETREAIKAKAKWEHMSLSAVMRNWWPELWEQVAARSPGRTERGAE